MLERKHWLLGMALAGMLAAAACALAAQKPEAITDATQAGPDYPFQGEYAGEADGTKLGAQVIALGKGTFRAVFHPGGLPGAGWDGKTRVRVDGKSVNEEARFGTPGTGWNGCIANGVFEGQTDGGVSFELKKVERKSSTLGAKPPDGAVILFDGTSADAWQNGKMTADGLLMVGTRTKQGFGDFTLHFEFRTPYMPEARGQDRGNSGLFLQDRYEVQILDSFGLDGKNNECGGLYSQKAPDVNMCLPPLAWQTFDIDFESARFDAAGEKTKPAVVTVRHNGVIIHDRFALPGSGPAGKKEDSSGGTFQIQNHGNPVHVRNVWVIEKK